jgi:hypothetical protein
VAACWFGNKKWVRFLATKCLIGVVQKSDFFDVAVRISGLVILFWGLWHLLDIFGSLPDWVLGHEDWTSTLSYCVANLIYGVPGVVAGFGLLVWGHVVTAWAYPPSSTPPPIHPSVPPVPPPLLPPDQPARN